MDISEIISELRDQYDLQKKFNPVTIVKLMEEARNLEAENLEQEKTISVLREQNRELEIRKGILEETTGDVEELRGELSRILQESQESKKMQQRRERELEKVKQQYEEVVSEEPSELKEWRERVEILSKNNRDLANRNRDLMKQIKSLEENPLSKELENERKRSESLSFRLRTITKTSQPSSKEMEKELVRLTDEKYQPMMKEIRQRLEKLEKTEKRDDEEVKKLIQDMKETREKYDKEIVTLKENVEKKGSMAALTDKLVEEVENRMNGVDGPTFMQVRAMIQEFTNSKQFEWEVGKIITQYLSELET